VTDSNAFDRATRIATGDEGIRYDNVAIALHWSVAVLVIVQFALAETWDWFAKPTTKAMESVHISLGVLLTALILARIAWRLVPAHKRFSLQSGWVRIASKAVHYLLYALLVTQAGLGFAFRWAQGHAVEFFGLFAIAGPFGEMERPARRLLHELHEYVGWAIIIIALAHALAALYHHYVLKDRLLERMLPLARH